MIQKKLKQKILQLRFNSIFFNFLFVIIFCLIEACNSNSEGNQGLVQIIEEPDSKYKILNPEKVKNADSVYLRFFSDFEMTTLIVKVPGTNFQQTLDSLNTIKSVAFTDVVLSVPKNNGKYFILEIDTFIYKIEIPKDRYFVDIYYDKKKKTISVAYTNSIIVLS